LLIYFRSEFFFIYTFVQLISFLCNLAPWWLNWYPKSNKARDDLDCTLYPLLIFSLTDVFRCSFHVLTGVEMLPKPWSMESII